MFRTMSETKQVQFEGAEFTVQMIKRKIFRRLSSELAQAKLEIAGLDELLTKDALERIQKESPEKFFRVTARLNEVYLDFVRYGIADHKGLQAKDGKEILFKKEGDLISEETLDHYDLNGLILKLGTEVITFNTLGEGERKNS